MEIMIQWFWIIKGLFALLVAFSFWQAYKKKSYYWFVFAFLLVTLIIMAPVKMDVNTHQQQQISNNHIESVKILPERVQDDSFKEKTSKSIGITESDLK